MIVANGNLISLEEAESYEQCTMPGGYSPWATREGCVYNAKKAQIAINFFPQRLVHIKGPLGGKPIVLERWQKEIIATLFGWYRADGTRRFRMSYIEIPRKAGKSLMCAGIALLCLFLDNEPGAEVYSCAGDRKQSGVVFGLAKEQVLRSPAMSNRAQTYLNSITRIDPSTGATIGVYEALSAEAGTKHGANPSCIIFDELHVQKKPDLWEAMITGIGARVQPLIIAITTAGHDRESVCYQQHQYAAKVRDGVVKDPEFLPVIYGASRDDDWTSADVWRKAQPNLDVSVPMSFYESEFRRASENKSYENSFKRLYLNIWTEQADRAMPMDDWDACPGIWVEGCGPRFSEYRSERIKELSGRVCYGGLDIATKTDIAAFVLLFPDESQDRGEPEVLSWFWSTEEMASRRSSEPNNEGKYRRWHDEGHLNLIWGSRIEQGIIEKEILELNDQFLIRDIAYDPWNAEAIRQHLEAAGIEMVEFGQTLKNFNEPLKELLSLVTERRLRHGGDPILRWMATNLATYMDGNGNIRPDKKHSGDKIDGIVALVMALGRSMFFEDEGAWDYQPGQLLG